MNDDIKSLNEVDDGSLESMYLEMCAALISMTGKNEVFIPARLLPMHGFSIMRRLEPESHGVRVRLVYDDAEKDPTGKDMRS